MLRRVVLLLLCCAVLLTDLSSARADHPDLPDTPSTAESGSEASDAAPPRCVCRSRLRFFGMRVFSSETRLRSAQSL